MSEAVKYLSKVRNLLPYSAAKKKDILSDFENSVYEVCKEQPDTTFNELTTRFGTPSKVAADFVREAGISEMLAYLSLRKKIFKRIILTLCIILISLICYEFYCLSSAIRAQAEMDALHPEQFENGETPPEIEYYFFDFNLSDFIG